MALSLKELEQINKTWQAGKAKQAEMANKGNQPAPTFQKVPTLDELSHKQAADNVAKTARQTEKRQRAKEMNNISKVMGDNNTARYNSRFSLDTPVQKDTGKKLSELALGNAIKQAQETRYNAERIEESRARREANRKRIEDEVKAIQSKGDLASQEEFDRYDELLNTAKNRGFIEHDSPYLVSRDRYNQLAKTTGLENDLEPLAMAYSNDAATRGRGVRAIEGMGYNSVDDYVDQLSKRYELTPDEIKDVYKTYQSNKTRAQEEQMANKMYDYGQKHPVLGGTLSALASPASGVEGYYNTAANILTGDDRNQSRLLSNITNESKRGGAESFDSKAGQNVYNFAVGGLGMALNAKGGGLPAITAMGGNTANEAMNMAIERGVAPEQAAAYGLAAGGADTLFNAVGFNAIDDALKKETVKTVGDVLRNIGAGALTEAGENVAQDITQTVADEIINGGNSELRSNYQNYIQNGLSAKDAFTQTAVDYATQLGGSAATGAIGGAVFAGMGMTGENVALPVLNKAAGKAIDWKTARDSQKASDLMARLLSNEAEVPTMDESNRIGAEPITEAQSAPIEAPSLLTKNTNSVDDVANTVKNEPVNPVNNTIIDTKELSKIQFANDADRAEFNNAWSEFERANAEFEDALVNAEDEADIIDAITRIDDTYRNMQNTASMGTVTDKSGQNSLRDIKKNFKANTKGMVINLPTEMRNEMGFKDMTMRQINSKMSSLGGNDYIKFSAKGGTPIDEVWDELVRASGNQLSPDVANSADMAASLIDYVDSLKVDGRGIEQIEANIDSIIPDEYWDDIARRAEEAQQRLVDEGKVIAEDIGINPNTTLDEGANIIEEEIARNEPYELSFDPSEYENGVEKVSKAYTNTGRNANGWNEAEYNKYTDPSRYTYESKSEIESVNRATAMREEEGREAFKNRVLNAEELTSEEVDGLMMEWRETIQEARDIESSGGDASALWEESNRIFKRVQTESTKNAQALQALAKWSRNTPEGLLMHTENIVNGKVKTSKSELQKFLDKFAKKNKDIDFSADFQKNFLEEAEKLQDLDLNSKEAKDIMGRLGRMTNAELPVKMNEKIQSLLMDNMLGNFRTLITRNAGGNIGLNVVEQTAQRPLAAAIDRLVSHKTGIRTQAGMTKEGLQEYMSGFKKGLTDEIHDIRTGLHTSRTGENTIENALNANRHVFKNKILDKFDSFVKNGLSVGDRPFYEAVYKQTLGDYNRLRATGQMGDIVNSLSDADFNTYAETAAHLNALTAVYQNDSAMSQALLGFKRSIGQLSEGTVGFDILSQFSMPFVKTPANVVDRAIDYSPLGLVRNIARTTREGGIGGANFDQNRFVNELSRNILGTGLMGGAAVAAGRNILNGAYSDDVDEKQLQKQSGMQEYALNIPTLDGKNYNMDISWLPVVGSNAVAAAAAVDAYRNGEGNVLNNIGSGLVQGGEALFDQSMFQGLQRLFGADNSYNSDTGIVGNALNTVKSGAGQLIPSLARQIAQVSDPYQRDVSNSNGGNYDVNSIINNIPGARQNLLAPKVDANGNLMEESQGRGMGMRFLEDMILPGRITEVTSHELDEEAVRLSDETGSEASFRPKPYRKDIDADKKLTNEEWVAYEQKFNSALTEAGNTVINSDAYKGLDAEAQNNLLSNVYKSVKSAINSEYNGKELSGGAKAYAEAGGGEAGIQAVVDYHTKGAVAKEKGLSNNNATQAIYDADGEQGLDDYAVIKEAGGNKKSYDQFNYYNSQAGSQTVPTLDSTSYMKKVGEIEKYNKDKKTNGLVSQQELADYLNAQKYNSSKADAYVKAFFGDDYIAYTTKKGRIGIKKKE